MLPAVRAAEGNRDRASPSIPLRIFSGDEEAQARRDETARRWNEPQLPATGWTDNAVRSAAASAVERAVTPTVGRYRAEAARAEQAAADADRRVDTRERSQQEATIINQWRAGKRQALQDFTDAARASIAQRRAVRAERAETMTPEELAVADAARDALVNDQARRRQLARRQQAAQTRRAAEHELYAPRHDRGGPGLGR